MYSHSYNTKMFYVPNVDQDSTFFAQFLESRHLGDPIVAFGNRSYINMNRRLAYTMFLFKEVPDSMENCTDADRCGRMKPERSRLALFVPASRDPEMSSYFQLVLPALAEEYDCDLFTSDKDGEKQAAWGEQIRTFHHGDFKQRTQEQAYQGILYFLGDPSDHSFMLPYLEKHRGIAVFHRLDTSRLGREWPLLVEERTEALVVHGEMEKRELEHLGFTRVLHLGLPVRLPIVISLLNGQRMVLGGLPPLQRMEDADTALRCMKRMIEGGMKQVCYLALGHSPEETEQFKELAASLELEGKAEWRDGQEDQAEARLLAESDVILALTPYLNGEGYRKLLEVLAGGKPVIALRTETLADWPDDGPVWLMEPGEGLEDRLLELLGSLYRNKEWVNRKKQAARQFVVAYHSARGYAERLGRLAVKGWSEPEELIHPASRSLKISGFSPEDSSPPAKQEEPVPVAVAESDPAPQPQTAQPAPEPEKEQEPAPPVIETVVLHPNRYRRLRVGKQWNGYFSFNLAVVPPDADLVSAVMRIRTYSGSLHIYRIVTSWSVFSIVKHRPRRKPLPMYRARAPRGQKLASYDWDCTALAERWRQDQLGNHGVVVPCLSRTVRPVLTIRYRAATPHHPEGQSAG